MICIYKYVQHILIYNYYVHKVKAESRSQETSETISVLVKNAPIFQRRIQNTSQTRGVKNGHPQKNPSKSLAHHHLKIGKAAERFKTQQAKSRFWNLPKCQWIPKVWTSWSFSKFLNISFHSGEFSQCLQERTSCQHAIKARGQCSLEKSSCCGLLRYEPTSVFEMVKAHTKILPHNGSTKGCQLEINWM